MSHNDLQMGEHTQTGEQIGLKPSCDVKGGRETAAQRAEEDRRHIHWMLWRLTNPPQGTVTKIVLRPPNTTTEPVPSMFLFLPVGEVQYCRCAQSTLKR